MRHWILTAVVLLVMAVPVAAFGQANPEENQVEFWCDSGGVKYEPVDTPFIVPEPPEGKTWTLLVLKGGTTNEVIQRPVVGQGYSHSEHDNSHVILCWEDGETSTTTSSTTTSSSTSTTTSSTTSSTTSTSTTTTVPASTTSSSTSTTAATTTTRPATTTSSPTTTSEAVTTTAQQTTTSTPTDDTLPVTGPYERTIILFRGALVFLVAGVVLLIGARLIGLYRT